VVDKINVAWTWRVSSALGLPIQFNILALGGTGTNKGYENIVVVVEWLPQKPAGK
jgi:hypothetical protein